MFLNILSMKYGPKRRVSIFLKYKRSPAAFQKDNYDLNSFLGYIIKKNSSRGPKHGQSERQIMFFKAKDMLRKAKKQSHPTILSRWKADEEYRKSLDISTSEKKKSCFPTKLLWRNTTIQLRKLNKYEIQSIGFSR